MALINLNNKLSNTNLKYSKGSKKKILVRILVALFILLVVTLLPARVIYGGVRQLSTHGKLLAAAYKSQDYGLIKKEVTATKNSLSGVNTSLNFLIWMNLIPFVGGFWQDAKAFSGAGVQELTAVEALLDSLEPYKGELGFTGQPIAGQDRITQSLKILEKSIPFLDSVKGNFKQAADEVKDINTDKYPEEFRGLKVRENLRVLKDSIGGIYHAATEGREALEITPSMLGQNGAKNYLLLFQNDKEIRATGGFITAYAFLKIDKGQVSTSQSDDIYRLDERLLGTCQSKICPLSPPAPIVRYLPEVTGKQRSAWSMRDSNLSPDLPTSAKEFIRMYELLGQGFPFDGIIYIDTHVVEDLIAITGSIDIFGTPYSANLDARCNCPNVIFELENYAEVAAKGTQDRKAILGVLMQQLLAKSVGSDIEKAPQFINSIVSLANAKHVMFYLQDSKNQQALSKLNWAGQIKDFDGDYLHINDSNFAGGKSNLYVEQIVTQDITRDKDGLKKKLTIEYKNSEPFNTWLNGINRDYVRVYVPKGSKLISSKGSENQVTTIEDLNKTVFEAFVVVRPQNSRKLEFEYTVPQELKGDMKLLIQKQPGAKEFRYKVNVNGRLLKDIKLDSDKEFKFSI